MKKYRFNIDLNEEELKKLNELTIFLFENKKISSLNKTKIIKEYVLEGAYDNYIK
jgi:hypothetical protein